MVGKRAPLEERFWIKVDRRSNDECWEWTATKNNMGYGMLGHGRGHKGKVLAHRISFELANGPIPKGAFILHKCDNSRCVNPSHLYAGNQLQNVHDAQSRNRHVNPPSHPGTANFKAKLTEQDVLRIRSEIQSGKSTITIAKELGMHKTTIYDIRNRKTWTHI